MVENGFFLKTVKQNHFLSVKGTDQVAMKFWIISNSNKFFRRFAVGLIVPFSSVP